LYVFANFFFFACGIRLRATKPDLLGIFTRVKYLIELVQGMLIDVAEGSLPTAAMAGSLSLELTLPFPSEPSFFPWHSYPNR
jgi:hypothetical protein